jgi:hypothetical protein
MPKPLKFPTKLLIGLDAERLSAIDAWRRQQEDLPTRSEAIRRLVDQALTAAKPPPKRTRTK